MQKMTGASPRQAVVIEAARLLVDRGRSELTKREDEGRGSGGTSRF
jgi:hypothetical protein